MVTCFYHHAQNLPCGGGNVSKSFHEPDTPGRSSQLTTGSRRETPAYEERTDSRETAALKEIQAPSARRGAFFAHHRVQSATA